MMNLYLKCIKIKIVVYFDYGILLKDVCVFVFFRIYMGFWLECDFLEFVSNVIEYMYYFMKKNVLWNK